MMKLYYVKINVKKSDELFIESGVWKWIWEELRLNYA